MDAFQATQFLLTRSKIDKFFILISSIILIGFISRSHVTPIWPGDGMGQWAFKALEFKYHESLSYSEDIQIRLNTWLNYPLLHTIEQLVNMIILPVPHAYSVKAFDSFYIIGNIFCVFAFLGFFKFNFRKRLLGSFVAIFAPRELIDMVISGYAEMGLSYFLLLSVTLLFIKNKNHKLFIVSGIALGMLSITKSEGIFRAIIIVLSYLIWTRKEWKKNILAMGYLILPLFALVVINKLSLPVKSAYTPYTSEMKFSYFLTRYKYAFLSFYYSIIYSVQGVFKCFWPLSLLIYLKFGLKKLFKIGLDAEFIFYLTLIIGGNLLFNLLPAWIAPLKVDYRMALPENFAKLAMMRLNLQVAPVLSLLITILILKNFEENSK